jgi:hypothetical protein
MSTPAIRGIAAILVRVRIFGKLSIAGAGGDVMV